MKKLLTILMATIMMFALATTALAANLTIESGGTEEEPSSALVDALADESREDGDIITLPAGYFTAPTEIEQSVTIKGAGSTRTTEDTTAITTLVFDEPLVISDDDVSFTIEAVNIDAIVTGNKFSSSGVFKLNSAQDVSLTINSSFMEAKDFVGVSSNYVYSAIYINDATSPTINIDDSYLFGRYTLMVQSYTGSDGRGNSHNTTYAKFNITNSWLDGWTTGNMRGEDTTFYAYNSTFCGVNVYSGSSNSYATFVMTDGSIDSTYTFEKCTITASNTGDQAQKCFNFQYGATDNTLVLIGCTFETTTANGVNTGIISAGSNVSDYPVTEGNDVVLDGTTYEDLDNNSGSGQLYVVVDNMLVKSGAVAVIGLDSYTSLEDAVTAAQDGETITMISDYEMGISTITISDKSITIDVAGYDITDTSLETAFKVESDATLRLTDTSEEKSGSIELSASGYIANQGTLYIGCDLTVYDDTALYTEMGKYSKTYITDGATVTNNGTVTIAYANELYIEDGATLINNGILNNTTTYGLVYVEGTLNNTSTGTINNNYYICIYEGATVSNLGTVNNTGCFEYDYLPATEVFGSVAYYVSPWEGVDCYEFYPTLAAAIADAGDGDTVYVVADCTASNISITKDMTITGTDGATITYGGNNMFYINDDVDVTFDSVDMVISNTGIMVNEAGDGATVTIKNCTIASDDAASYIVVGDTSVGTEDGDNYYYDLTFTGNTITGQFQKPIHILMGTGNTLLVSNNSFTGEAKDSNNRSVTIIVDYSGTTSTKISVTNNTFDNLYKAISVDSWAATPTFTMTGNSFTNCKYAFDISSTNDYNDGLSLAYNYFEGELPVILDSSDDSTYYNATNLSGLVFYPYYKDSALTTLVYEDETEKTPAQAASDALDTALSDSASSSDIAAAVDVVTAVDKDVIAADDTLVDLVNDLDDALVESNGSLEVSTGITQLDAASESMVATAESVEASDLVTPTGDDYCAEAQGLAVSVVGNDTIDEGTTITVGLTIVQTAASATDTIVYNDETEENEVVSTEIVVTYDITPFVTTKVENASGTTSSVIDNEEITVPVTFKLYLPSIFEDTNRATLTHDGEDKGTYVVYHDGSDNYIYVTVTHFSEFVVTYAENVSTSTSSSSVKKYSNDLEVGDNGSAYATPLSASSGTTVYIYATPDTGYEVDEVLVDDGDITVTDEGDNVYSYKQPAYAVDIKVTFVATDDVEEDEEEEVEEETTTSLTDFEDVVAGAWYEEYIAAAVEAGIMQGNSTTEFAPNGTTTRAMMIQVLFNLEDQPETENDEAAWYSEALAWGMAAEVTDGSDITGNLTREQLVTMLYRYAVANGEDVSIGEDTNILSYNDALDVADWAMEAFQWACGSGIINGDTDGNLNPQNTATRAELAKIMVSYLGL